MRLTVETGPQAGTVVTLQREVPTVLGSGADCALRVREAGVQEQHAVVKALRGEGFGLKALAPGVRVNGSQIEATPLADGDIIEIGTTRIAFGETQKKGLPAISGYRIQEELGRGGMGVVYRAEQVSLHRQVALKVLSHDLTEDGKFVSNFVREAQAAAKLHHPNVVSVFDVEHDGDTYFFSMELMQNGSAEDWLKQNGAMPADRALQVIADAAAGLAYAESLGIVHRDLKPDNLMLDQHGVIKIADLGLAGSDIEDGERAIGTPHFMAPEQVLRKNIDHRSDLYALGCTFYRLVTGRTPFRGQTVKDILRAQVKDDPEPAHRVNNKVPSEVSAIIQRMMAKEPADRFQTANELLEEVEVLLRPPAKKGLWIGLAAAAVLAAGGAIWWAVNKQGETVTEKVFYDDPEKQRFAEENRDLKAAAREDKANIALLTTRVSGLVDEPLAQALDRIARDHPNTRAAIEAGERATRVREDVRQREQREIARQQKITGFVATLQKNIAPQVLAHDYALAMQALEAPPPAGLEGDRAVTAKVEALRAGVVDSARARIQELEKAIETAATNKDADTLGQAVDALADNIAARNRWPEATLPDLDAAAERVKAGRTALAALLREHRQGLWADYGAMFGGSGSIALAVSGWNFAKAADAADAFAAASAEEEAGVHAAGFAAGLRRASAFATALEQAAAGGQLQLELPDDVTLTTARWDRAEGQLVFVDPKRRPSKERAVATATLGLEDWFALADQVPAHDATGRDCFLAFVSLAAHARAAAAYLSGLDHKNDDSGTSDNGYALTPDTFGILLRQLPQGTNESWVATMRGELLAGQRLAAGLRALSERRNRAAAGHLEKLQSDHQHSYLVLVLP